MDDLSLVLCSTLHSCPVEPCSCPGGASPRLHVDALPVGHYQFADGRAFYGMNEFELRAFSREGWRLQQIADIRLAIRLDALRSSSPGDAHRAASASPGGMQYGLFCA